MAASSEDTAGTSQGRYTGLGTLPPPTMVTDERYLCVSSYFYLCFWLRNKVKNKLLNKNI